MTGKSTLLGDLASKLCELPDTQVVFAENCAKRLFERIQDGSVRVSGGSIPKKLDDIDRMGLRGFFQRNLPDALAFEVEYSLLRAVRSAKPALETYLLIDRWFPDIYAQTVSEVNDVGVHRDVRDRCATRCESLLQTCLSKSEGLRLVNVVLPVRYSTFRVVPDALYVVPSPKVRTAWEDAFFSSWGDISKGPEPHRITTADRRKRVAQVLEYLQANTPDQNPEST